MQEKNREQSEEGVQGRLCLEVDFSVKPWRRQGRDHSRGSASPGMLREWA